MDYYINPMWLYLIDVFARLHNICFVILALSFAIWVIGGISIIDFPDEVKAPEIMKPWKKVVKQSFVALCVSGIGFLIIPSKETSEKMLVAELTTKTNVESVKEDIKEAVDYIFDKFNDASEKDYREQ